MRSDVVRAQMMTYYNDVSWRLNYREPENCQGSQDSDVLISVQVTALLYDGGITSLSYYLRQCILCEIYTDINLDVPVLSALIFQPK